VGVTLDRYRRVKAIDRERSVELRQIFVHLLACLVALKEEGCGGQDKEQRDDQADDSQSAARAGRATTSGRGGISDGCGVGSGGALVEVRVARAAQAGHGSIGGEAGVAAGRVAAAHGLPQV